MNKIQQLINELCPNGVEYKRLEDLVVWNKNFKDANNIFKPIKIPDILSKIANEIATDDGNVKIITTGLKDLYTVKEGNEDYIYNSEVITIPSGGSANIKYHNGYFINCGNIIGISKDKTILNTKYLYYFLIEKKELIESFYRGGGIKHPSMPDILRIKIPIPPLKIQEEIASVLDSFAELTAELNLRSAQYVYYRDRLLDFRENQEIKIKKLGDFCSVKMCKRVLSRDTNDISGIPFHTISTIGGKSNKFISHELFNELRNKYSYPSKGQILISTSGTIGKILEFDGEDQYFQDSNIVWLENDEKDILNKYLYYFLKTKPWSIGKTSTIERLYNKDIENITIKIPSISIQRKIIYFLDNFETISFDLNIGLPKESELRTKQYEYYRDQIFNYLNTGFVDRAERERERERDSI